METESQEPRQSSVFRRESGRQTVVIEKLLSVLATGKLEASSTESVGAEESEEGQERFWALQKRKIPQAFWEDKDFTSEL